MNSSSPRAKRQKQKHVSTSGQGPLIAVEYYQPLFHELTRHHIRQLREATQREPLALRAKYLAGFPNVIAANRGTAWDFLRTYSLHVEQLMKGIIEQHSVWYWIHLYRRIAPMMSPHMPGKSDATTIYLTRLNLETAFAKYGSLTRLNDIRLSSAVESSAILGGEFIPSFERFCRKINWQHPIGTFTNLLEQWVLVDFTENDYINAYRLEGLAYEYWHVAATMRAVGKGTMLGVQDGGFIEHWPAELARLIESFDERQQAAAHPSSFTGMSIVPSPLKKDANLEYILSPRYNVERIPLRNVISDFRTGKSLVPNFIFGRVPFAEFVRLHDFASDAFQAVHGFALEDIYRILYAVGTAPLLELSRDRDASARTQRFIRYSQRAYLNLSIEKTPLRDYVLHLIDVCQPMLDEMFSRPLTNLEAAVNFLTLTEENQTKIALWTHGPRHLFVPHGNGLIVDLHAIPAILEKLFVGVRYSGDERGYRFEDAFRRTVTHAKHNLLPHRTLRSLDGVSSRETDAAIRIGSTLVLLDCRSIERPLDYEIGNPKTIDYRIAELSKKVTQTRTLRAFVLANPKGTNYDFSWARNVVSAVVSPFVEWIWSCDEELWLEGGFPAVMSVDESLDYLKYLSKPRVRKRGKRSKRKSKR